MGLGIAGRCSHYCLWELDVATIAEMPRKASSPSGFFVPQSLGQSGTRELDCLSLGHMAYGIWHLSCKGDGESKYLSSNF